MLKTENSKLETVFRSSLIAVLMLLVLLLVALFLLVLLGFYVFVAAPRSLMVDPALTANPAVAWFASVEDAVAAFRREGV